MPLLVWNEIQPYLISSEKNNVFSLAFKWDEVFVKGSVWYLKSLVAAV